MDWFGTAEDPETCRQKEPSRGPEILRVSEISAIITKLLDDRRLQDIWIRGEVTNYKLHSRGHHYFSLSEHGGGEPAVIQCVMWKSSSRNLEFTPENGMEVILFGHVGTYAPQGKYQFYAEEMQPAGAGEKHLLVERWKKELLAEGVFSETRKRPLPVFPLRVGVVTSETGAVLQDIRNVISRRYPLEILLSPTQVQGDLAHKEIAAAIRRIDGKADVLIVARGGGSFEDLFPFNHPDVVRAIASCITPVVSAIGHETDITLADLAADLRAPTPSAAAECVVPDRDLLREELRVIQTRIGKGLLVRLGHAREDLLTIRDRMHPARFLRKLQEKRQQPADLAERMVRAIRTRLERERLLVDSLRDSLVARSPQEILSRGYCIAEINGAVVKSAALLQPEDILRLRMQDGSALVQVRERKLEEKHDKDV